MSNGSLAVRAGVIYSANGQATIGLPAGDYTVYAGRGFEFDVDSVRLSLKPGDFAQKELAIHREVPTEGYVSCDPTSTRSPIRGTATQPSTSVW